MTQIASRRWTPQGTATLVLAICMAGSVISLREMEQLRPQATLEEMLYLRSPKTAKRIFLGFTGLAASIYWTRTVQYFGSKHHEHAMRYDLLPQLLDLTTSLDPHLTVAYESGSIFLAQPPPEGAGKPDLAAELVERGIRENPEDWHLYYQLGFIHYIERHDFEAAANAFDRGSRVPGAHPWVRIMAAMMAQRGGDIQTSRYLWTNIYQSSEDPLIKQNALVRLMALRVDEDVTQLEQLVHVYRERTGQIPTGWQDLISVGILRGVPLDPTKRPYLLNNGRLLVQDYQRFPFIRKGLPLGKESVEFLMPGAVRPENPASVLQRPLSKRKR